MHISEGDLHAYLDKQLGPEQLERVAQHLDACLRCRERAGVIQDRALTIERHMARLQHGPVGPPQPAWAARMKLEERLNETGKEHEDMMTKLFNRRTRFAWASLVVVALALSLFAFPAVRAAANSFLGLFRVQQISVVEVNPAALENLDNAQFEGQFESFFEKEVQIEQLGERQQVSSAEEASAAAGFPVRFLGEAESDQKVYVQPGGQAKMTVDLAKIQLLLDLAGRSDVRLPAEIDGATVTVDLPTSVEVTSSNCVPGRCTRLMQVPSPTIDAPPGLDIAQIGEAFLQVLGMSREEAERFSDRIDWTSTLLLPVPTGTEYREVPVDGVTGVLVLERGKSNRGHYGLMWIKDGIVYLLTGTGSASAAMDAAGQIK